ncbi:DUF4255 domain-containing protein [soil metagenome]
MIHLVDDALERFLRREVPLPLDVDVSFATPERRWGAGITRPTINLFLWEVVSDPARSTTGVQERHVDERLERRVVPPLVDLRYVVTAWASEHRDEHQLLGALLRAIVANRFLTADHVPDDLAHLPPMQLLLGTADRKPEEFWSSLDGQLKPSLGLTVVVSVDALPWIPAAAPPSSLTIDGRRHAPPPAPAGPSRTGLRRKRRGESVLAERRPSEPSPGAAPLED